MWQTSHGDRVLLGEEANAFLDAVGYLRDMVTTAVETDEPYRTGVTLFDALQPTQQMVALHQVTAALILPETPAPELTATLEATVYAIYRELYCLIEIEIDCCRLDDEFDDIMRRQALDAIRAPIEQNETWEPEPEERFRLPDSACEEFEVWHAVIEQLADRVLWDRDFELEEVLADKDPVETAAIKEYLGISPDYFAIAAPDAQSEEFRRIDRELVAIRNQNYQPPF